MKKLLFLSFCFIGHPILHLGSIFFVRIFTFTFVERILFVKSLIVIIDTESDVELVYIVYFPKRWT